MTDGNSYRMGLRPHLHEALCYKDVQLSILSFEVYGTSFGVTPRGHFSLLSHNKLLGYPSLLEKDAKGNLTQSMASRVYLHLSLH